MTAARLLDKKKARYVVVIDISPKASFADYFVIASGGTDRQIESLSEDVCDEMEKTGASLRNPEGRKTSGWILLDFGDVIISLLTDEMRERYSIEKIWGDCEFIDPEE